MLTARNTSKSPAIALCILSEGWIAGALTERHSGDSAGRWREVIHSLSPRFSTMQTMGKEKPPQSVDFRGLSRPAFRKPGERAKTENENASLAQSTGAYDTMPLFAFTG